MQRVLPNRALLERPSTVVKFASAVEHSKCMANVDAVPFDWDGVRVDSRRNYFRAYELALQEIGVTTTPREIYFREGQPTPEVIAAIYADRGIAITDAHLSALVQRRREHERTLGPRNFYPGMLRLLQRLRESGRKLALISGSFASRSKLCSHLVRQNILAPSSPPMTSVGLSPVPSRP